MSDKIINISGTNNRYLINKVNKKKKDTRKNILDIEEQYFQPDEQINILNNNYVELNDFINKEISKKINSYKQQDKKSNHFNSMMFITFEKTISLLLSTNCKCYYCNNVMYLLYKEKNDKRQWTLDRINNNEGHNINNVVSSCLDCNIQKKTRNHDDFYFTKNIVIQKKN